MPVGEARDDASPVVVIGERLYTPLLTSAADDVILAPMAVSDCVLSDEAAAVEPLVSDMMTTPPDVGVWLDPDPEPRSLLGPSSLCWRPQTPEARQTVSESHDEPSPKSQHTRSLGMQPMSHILVVAVQPLGGPEHV